MPGSPATSPTFGAPRFSDADDASFSSQVNGVTDHFDALAVRDDDARLSDERTPLDGSVTTAKIPNASITGAKLAAGTVTEANLAPDSVGAPEIAAGAVGTPELATGAVTAPKLGAGAVGTGAMADGAITPGKLDPTAGQSIFMPGDLKASAAVAPPTGWLLCDGRAVSRSTYAGLFAAISTAYGTGDGSTTFNLPDFRGRTIMGAGAGPGLTARAIGDKPGAEHHTHPIPGLSIPDLSLFASVAGHHHPLSANGGTQGRAVMLNGSSIDHERGALGPSFPSNNQILIQEGAGNVSTTALNLSPQGYALIGNTDDASPSVNGVALGASASPAKSTGSAVSGSGGDVTPATVANVFVKT
jgi:microcystin-dependent protein